MTPDAAGGGLPVVLLHGLTDSSACWPAVLPRLVAAGRRVVALDARGHGGRPVPDEPFTIAALAADAAAELRALDLGPAVVVGHSMGGVTAQELAATAPDLVAALVLEDPAWREAPVVADVDLAGSGATAATGADGADGATGADGVTARDGATGAGGSGTGRAGTGGAGTGGAGTGGADDVRLLGLAGTAGSGRVVAGVPVLDDPGRPEWLAGAIEALAGSTAEQIAARGRIDNPGWTDAEVTGWADAKTRVDPRLLAVPHRWTDRDWVEALADVRCPVTLLTAAPGAGVVSARQVARAAQVLGDRLTHVPSATAGHNIRRDTPEAYTRALDEALARADSAAR